ncbi:MAG: AMP-binding protein, partial [Deltaproteobacteria bacterium]|nr:AMP-binding protein [Deltaproteobacteria bacterium]
MLTPDSLGLAHHARTFPTKPALIIGSRRVTYAALNERVNRLARALLQAEVGSGDTVAAVLDNCVEWFELLNACGKIGARLVPIGYRLKGPEIAYMLNDSRAKVMLAASHLSAEVERALRDIEWSDDNLWVVGDDRWRGVAYEDRLAAESSDEPPGALLGGGFNALVYTSGTTGRPKGVDRDVDPAQAHLQLFGLAQMWGFGPDDTHLICGPLYHTAPSSYGQVHLLVGATVVAMTHFDASDALQLIERHRVTTSFMVPTHLARIIQLDAAEQQGHDLSSLRL